MEFELGEQLLEGLRNKREWRRGEPTAEDLAVFAEFEAAVAEGIWRLL
ncbi:hypothetical protein ACWDSJ_12455 [Nocardia sp. NPDC003482]